VRTEGIRVFLEGLNEGYGRDRIDFGFYPPPLDRMSFFQRFRLSKWVMAETDHHKVSYGVPNLFQVEKMKRLTTVKGTWGIKPACPSVAQAAELPYKRQRRFD
jgi:hypothetical protein